ncbi:MAG: hypothetical protein A2504_16875 [Bdellovibrionales bacterium RIFOXYD12_FULL_39_22]|nr:MAG: hypothetical protein A2385_05815 [Bdellovibrionales bacterium RIFOXYB1_FULL_39_21]OFZ41469.1 MAG: hypothetical protein A2485_04565 [Bdellovibrionales bacterium RIFOXYC12_FULL_39_17]OFZ50371.1 MAG: hypothetical protein A2404_02395 [Bdellovibrionales bacterium RIFOXYC1_FULL_39_130]OFZ76138.1 MAG: hypothetical protein A2451_09225 [Bdellovibrionales bacterium RIFOXYC2_FULL_39_8]OFZ77650.1 MAG: hypothetical protein A2560_16470 [Bdellovibrionales bacterium RIFOXYD1_FULL_39_84]OFZ92189.1 MAG:
MTNMELEQFIVSAKANGWVGAHAGGKKVPSSRLGAFDIIFDDGDFHYRDSFVGFSDFCGQEHVTFKQEPVWSMAYYGYLLNPKIFSGDEAVTILKKALTKMYDEKRFLGGFYYTDGSFEYRDMNFGDYKRFNGIEKIYKNGELVYELVYIGGEVKK